MGRLGRTVQNIIKGEVTKIIAELNYFEVEGHRVYVTPLYLPEFSPQVGDTVFLKDLEVFQLATKTAIIGKDSTFNRITIASQGIRQNVFDQEQFHDFFEYLEINNFYDNLNNIIQMDTFLRKVEILNVDAIGQQLFVKTLWKLLKSIWLKPDMKCIKLKLPRCLTRVRDQPRLYATFAKDFRHAFNTYPSKSYEIDESDDSAEIEFLCGVMVISHYHGYFMIYDPKTYLHVKFYVGAKNSYRFHNAFVLIKKYLLITEVMNDEQNVPLEYILVNERDIVLIQSSAIEGPQLPFYGQKELVTTTYRYVYYMHVVKKSDVIFGYKSSPELYLEAVCSIQANFHGFKRLYAILTAELIQLSLLLRENVTYSVFTNSPEKYENIFNYKELYALKNPHIRQVLVVDPNSVFQETNLQPSSFEREGKEEVLTRFWDVRSGIGRSPDNATLNFRLKIHKKDGQSSKQFPSRFPTRHDNIPYFGVGADFQLRLIFMEAGTDTTANQYIDTYLANRENHVVSLGLVSGAVVQINRVQINKRRYTKPSIFTTFDVVDFQAPSMCATCTFNDGWVHWREEESTTLANYIPTNCLVAATVLFRAVMDLEVSLICGLCRFLQKNGQYCSCSSQPELQTYMVWQLEDGVNPAFTVEVKDIELLLKLLNWDKKLAVEALKELCYKSGHASVNFLQISDQFLAQAENSGLATERLIWIVRNINFKLPILLNVLCLRQEGERVKPFRVLKVNFISTLFPERV
ncbi:uncharacterized protein [Euwallacea similis]|uniref:uncharacterized protein n=1 Tax=Euwallacea similis TaxID=1736056 RepID=UPI00344DBF70